MAGMHSLQMDIFDRDSHLKVARPMLFWLWLFFARILAVCMIYVVNGWSHLRVGLGISSK